MRKRIFLLLLVAVILAALVFWQIHQWRQFNWKTFREETVDVNWWLILGAVALVHAADALRAWRWAVLLRPVKRVSATALIAPQFVGFTARALFGWLGELVRPFIIARRTELSMSSQMAIVAVERLFDISSVTCLLGLALFSSEVRSRPYYGKVLIGGLVVIVFVAVAIWAAFQLRRNGSRLAAWVTGRYGRRFPDAAGWISQRTVTFSNSLHTIHDVASFVIVALLSLAVWGIIAYSYLLVANAYREPLSDWVFAEVVLVMFASIAGGVAQLPAVGGGAQLATIGMMHYVFGVEPELATSCGILLWLVTFMSVIPLGIVLAHREHVSFRQLVKEEEKAEAAPTG